MALFSTFLLSNIDSSLLFTKGVGRKISRGEANGKHDRKIAFFSLFRGWGGVTEKKTEK